MADYKELLRRAVEALPENNGAARRAVYEKARSALVGQLRGLNPPLAARDITQHRLQLEDCIRQVEQEASEAVISGLKQHDEPAPAPAPASTPVFTPSPSRATPQVPARPATPPPAATRPAPKAEPAMPASKLSGKAKPVAASIEDIIAAAGDDYDEPTDKPEVEAEPESEMYADDEPAKLQPQAQRPSAQQAHANQPPPRSAAQPQTPPRPVLVPQPKPAARPTAVADEREEEAPQAPRPSAAVVASRAFGVPTAKPYDKQRRGPVFEPRRETPQPGPAMRAQSAARQQVAGPIAYLDHSPANAAMSTVREVELESEREPQPTDPQGAIDRAIAALDREARDAQHPANGARPSNGALVEMPAPTPVRIPSAPPRPAAMPQPARNEMVEAVFREIPPPSDTGFARAQVDEERSGGSAVTIFLLVFAILLAGAGGAGFWAWREGYIDFAAMFGKAATTTQQAAAPTIAPKPAPTPDPKQNTTSNTAAANSAATEPAPELKSADRLSASDQPAIATPDAAPPAAAPTVAPAPDEQTANIAPPAKPGAATPPVAASPGGSQSLLLEASEDGTTGAVPFSGTVEWTKGKDEMGQPTLVGKANIPARNLGVNVLIRKNSDPTLPASHLMEINFTVSDTFIGGSIAGLPGVLLKNEELVQGSPLVGASARVVGNSFLFALSSSPADITANKDLLTSRKWIDLAVIYATGKRAIITLEKDPAAESLFTDVITAWNKP